MRRLLSYSYIIFSVLFLFYLALPNPEFPEPPIDSLQSQEPGDTEEPLRRAYFTDLNREEVMEHYMSKFSENSFLSKLTYRLNYPPEEASTIIRDQTRSSFLEEITHPFRESFFVNGFSATSEKDTILIEGKVWNQKITVRYIPSNSVTRVIIGTFTLSLGWALLFAWKELLISFKILEK